MAIATPRQRRVRRAEVRERLVEAAGEILGEQGYEASVEEIAERAGFSRGAFYSNFSSKDELFLFALERRTNVRVAELEAAMSGETDVAGLLRALGGVRRPRKWSWSSFARNMQFLFQALTRRELHKPLRRMEQHRQRVFAEAAARLLAGTGAGVRHTEDVGRLLSALDHGLAIQTYLTGRAVPLDLEGVVALLVPAFLAGGPRDRTS
jgi:AcrR family transcriptional regulator